MEETNIIVNEEVMDVAEDITSSGGMGICGKVVGGAIVAGLIYGGYKLIKKLKANKQRDEYDEAEGDVEDEDVVIDEEAIEELNKKWK